jgi:Metallo-beta-lactamase superfamily
MKTRLLLALLFILSTLSACDQSTVNSNNNNNDLDSGIDTGTDSMDDSTTNDGGVDIVSDGDLDGDVDGDITQDATLTIEQMFLEGTSSGEGVLIVGPDGTRVLIDIGNDSHGDEILAILDSRFGERRVDWVVLTHYHADHIGSFDNLFIDGSSNDNNPVIVEKGFIIRGFIDVGPDMVDGDYTEMCQELRETKWNGKVFSLCEGDNLAPCEGTDANSPWPASGCNGLKAGNLEESTDDNGEYVTYITLGEGAKLYFYNASAHIATDSGIESAETSGIAVGYGETDPENARSLGGLVKWGDFIYFFNGDLTGAGDGDSPPIEGFYANLSPQLTEHTGGPLLIPAGSVDAAHISHHGYTSSTSEEWVDWIIPPDGSTRTAVVGSNMHYYRSPTKTVMDRLGPRLEEGWVWAPDKGTLASSHDNLRIVNASVVIEVVGGGFFYNVFGWDGIEVDYYETYASTSNK